jgi:hypothetical protein
LLKHLSPVNRKSQMFKSKTMLKPQMRSIINSLFVSQLFSPGEFQRYKTSPELKSHVTILFHGGSPERLDYRSYYPPKSENPTILVEDDLNGKYQGHFQFWDLFLGRKNIKCENFYNKILCDNYPFRLFYAFIRQIPDNKKYQRSFFH